MKFVLDKQYSINILPIGAHYSHSSPPSGLARTIWSKESNDLGIYHGYPCLNTISHEVSHTHLDSMVWLVKLPADYIDPEAPVKYEINGRWKNL